MTFDENITPMPTFEQAEYIKEHATADHAHEAHPIDEDIVVHVCDSKFGPALLQFDLALIQAVAVREVLPYNNDDETWVERNDDRHYFTCTSSTFYYLLAQAHCLYDYSYIEIEDAADIVEAHTRQYLRDVHDYEGDFGGQVANSGIDKVHEPTLCNAQNDEHRLRDEVPDGVDYGFVDRRGLVIEADTHE